MIMKNLLNYKEIFGKLSNERIGEIYSMGKQIGFRNLTYYFKDPSVAPISFISFKGPMHFMIE